METRDVEIAYAHDPATDGPDLGRVGQRLTLPKGKARKLVTSGEARYVDVPVDEVGRSLADLPDTEAHRVATTLGLDVAEGEPKVDLLERIRHAQAEQQVEAHAEDLLKLTKDELRDQYPAAAAKPLAATKTELVEAVLYPVAGEDLDADVQPDSDPADPDTQ